MVLLFESTITSPRVENENRGQHIYKVEFKFEERRRELAPFYFKIIDLFGCEHIEYYNLHKHASVDMCATISTKIHFNDVGEVLGCNLPTYCWSYAEGGASHWIYLVLQCNVVTILICTHGFIECNYRLNKEKSRIHATKTLMNNNNKMKKKKDSRGGKVFSVKYDNLMPPQHG